MERWRKDFHQKSKIYQQDVFSWRFKGLGYWYLDVCPQAFVQVAPSKN